MNVKYIGEDTDTFKKGQIFRVMFNEEAKIKFKGTHQSLSWEDDSVVRLVVKESPYTGIFVNYPFSELWEEVK